jgi:hypothetical protein
VRRLFLGPEIANFHLAASTTERLAVSEDTRAAAEQRSFERAKRSALRLLIAAAVLAALLVAILLITATDLARSAERALPPTRVDTAPEPD